VRVSLQWAGNGWSPAVKTGLSEVIGAWKILAISAPRKLRIAASDARALAISSRQVHFVGGSNRAYP
jgi:hypothetical protein